MKKNNKKLNLLTYFKIDRAVIYIALFIFSVAPIYSQINEIQDKYLWISRDSMINKQSIQSALTFASKSGFNKVFLQIRGRGDAFYNSNIVSKNINIDIDFDPLEYAIKLGHELDLEIHTWINCYVLWSDKSLPMDNQHILYKNPLWTEYNIYGKLDARTDLNSQKSPLWEGIYLSPMVKEVNQYLYKIILEIYRKYDIDGLHLDYIRYQDEYYGFHPNGRSEFDELFNVDPLDISRGIISVRYGWEQSYVDSIHVEWNKFKQNKITELLELINEDIQKDIPISVAVKPNLIDAKYRWHQNWQDWLEKDLVDFVVPMNYSTEIKTFMINIQIIKNNIDKDLLNKIIMGISTYNQNSESVLDKIFLSSLNGFKKISIFSYNSHKDNIEWFDPIIESINASSVLEENNE